MPSILVVDDNTLNLKLFQTIIEQFGCEAHNLPGGTEVAETARRLRPDAIFMDICMPGVTGVEAATALKADPATRDIPIYAVTAAPPEDFDEIKHGALFTGILRKPVSFGQIAELLRALGAKSA